MKCVCIPQFVLLARYGAGDHGASKSHWLCVLPALDCLHFYFKVFLPAGPPIHGTTAEVLRIGCCRSGAFPTTPKSTPQGRIPRRAAPGNSGRDGRKWCWRARSRSSLPVSPLPALRAAPRSASPKQRPRKHYVLHSPTGTHLGIYTSRLVRLAHGSTPHMCRRPSRTGGC